MGTDRATRRPRRPLLRLLQLSPIIALALLIGVYGLVPGGLSATVLNVSASVDDLPPEYVDRVQDAMITSYFEGEMLESLGVHGPEGSLAMAAQSTWDALTRAQERFIESSVIVPFGAERDDEAYAHLAEWEDRNGTDVWVFALPYPAEPPLVAAAIPEAATPLVTAVRAANLDWQARRELEDVPVSAELLAHALWTVQDVWRDDPLPPLSTSSVRGGGGWGTDEYMIGEHGVRVGGETYRFYLIGPGHTSSDADIDWMPESLSLLAELAEADPRDPGFADAVSDVAEHTSMAILVLGPIEYASIPLRTPETVSGADAHALGEALWPAHLFAGREAADSEPLFLYESAFIELDEATAARAGGDAGVALTIGMYEGYSLSHHPEPAPGQHPGPTLLFFTAWNAQALSEAAPAPPTLRAVQSSLARNLPWLLGALFALLAVTLVASPIAVAYEHRLETRARALEEMSRMRRDAHDRVYNRLSALSKQVTTSAADADTAATPRLRRVAEEIRTTVGELQGILGDEGPHRGATLARQPLGVQLGQVCAAQASLLGIEVECAIEEDAEIPDVPPALGWDLQCVTEEAIANAVRHGGATSVTVALAADAARPDAADADSRLLLTVSDNGSGTPVSSADDAGPGSTGLRGMRARAERWGGSVRFEPAETGSVLAVRVAVPPAD